MSVKVFPLVVIDQFNFIYDRAFAKLLSEKKRPPDLRVFEERKIVLRNILSQEQAVIK